MTAAELLGHLEQADNGTDYAGPEARFDDWSNVSTILIAGSQPEVARPTLFAGCGDKPPTSPSPCGC